MEQINETKQLKYDLLNYLVKEGSLEEDLLSDLLGISLEKVQEMMSELIEEGYLNEDFTLTPKKYNEQKALQPKNAIILADDLGLGMLTVDRDIPVGLLEVNGTVIIERLIEQLQEAEIEEINIVIGYAEEKYEYLKEKYQVNLIYHADHAYQASFHTLKLVKDHLSNSYILPGNIWAETNPFSKNESYSWYGILDTVDDYSTVRLKQPNRLMRVEKGKAGNTMTGIAYLLKEDADFVKNRLEEKTEFQLDDTVWESLLFDDNEMMKAYPKIFSSNQIYLINDYSQLRHLEEDSTPLDAEIMDIIASELEVKRENIQDIFILEEGKTNSSFRFTAKNKEYIMRIPGKGTEELVNRYHEYVVYKVLKGREISDEVLYISPENGYKISKFINGARSCDPHNQKDVAECMAKLREFHDQELEVDHEFNPFTEIEKYEGLRGGKASKYDDYMETKENIMSLKEVIDQFPKEKVLSHCDSVPGNFLLADGEVYLIDWEYAGMQDPHIDIAMFALSAMYTREELDELIASYFVEGYDDTIKYKIYSYVAVAGLLWSNWTEYKEIFGVEYGKYSLKQYQAAKEYYSIVEKEYLSTSKL